MVKTYNIAEYRRGTDRRTGGRRTGKASSVSGVSRMRKWRKLKRKIILGICFYFCITGVIATCWILVSLLFSRKVHAEDDFSEKGAVSGDFQDGNMTGMSEEEMRMSEGLQEECRKIFSNSEGLLILVNKEHELPNDYQPELRNICHGRLQAADILYEDLCDMLEDAGRSGYEYWIASAYRDRAYQQGLIDEDVEQYMAKGYSYAEAMQKTLEYTMPAGYSEHETGLALDILCSTNTLMDESQASEPGNRWLQEHCHEYGFILRYPPGQETMTGIRYEPWHFRYVGKKAAKFLAENDWTLEDFYKVI